MRQWPRRRRIFRNGTHAAFSTNQRGSFSFAKGRSRKCRFHGSTGPGECHGRGQRGFHLAAEGRWWQRTDIEVMPGDPDFIINMSVWRDIAALEAFVYRQRDHRAVLARREKWFDAKDSAFALWWVPSGHSPTAEEGMAKVAELARTGPTASVFTFHTKSLSSNLT